MNAILLMLCFTLPLHIERQSLRDEVDRFPPQSTVDAVLKFLQARIDHNESLLIPENRPWIRDTINDVLADTRKRQEAWRQLDCCRNYLRWADSRTELYPYPYPEDDESWTAGYEDVRAALDELRQVLGDGMYYRGAMPETPYRLEP